MNNKNPAQLPKTPQECSTNLPRYTPNNESPAISTYIHVYLVSDRKPLHCLFGRRSNNFSNGSLSLSTSDRVFAYRFYNTVGRNFARAHWPGTKRSNYGQPIFPRGSLGLAKFAYTYFRVVRARAPRGSICICLAGLWPIKKSVYGGDF